RYSEPKAFQQFSIRCQRPKSAHTRADLVLVGLLEAISDRIADVLERLAGEVDTLSLEIFEPEPGASARRDLHLIIRDIGRQGDLNSKARESLVSIGRLISFLTASVIERDATPEVRGRLKTLTRDANALADHASFLSNK